MLVQLFSQPSTPSDPQLLHNRPSPGSHADLRSSTLPNKEEKKAKFYRIVPDKIIGNPFAILVESPRFMTNSLTDNLFDTFFAAPRESSATHPKTVQNANSFDATEFSKGEIFAAPCKKNSMHSLNATDAKSEYALKNGEVELFHPKNGLTSVCHVKLKV